MNRHGNIVVAIAGFWISMVSTGPSAEALALIAGTPAESTTQAADTKAADVPPKVLTPADDVPAPIRRIKTAQETVKLAIARMEVSVYEVQLPESAPIEFDALTLQKSAETNLELETALRKIGDVNVLARIDRNVHMRGALDLKTSSAVPFESSRTKSPDGNVTSNVSYQTLGTVVKFERIYYSEHRKEMLGRFSIRTSMVRPSRVSTSEGVFAFISSSYDETSEIRMVAGVPEIGLMIHHDDPSVPPRAFVVRYCWTPITVMEFSIE